MIIKRERGKADVIVEKRCFSFCEPVIADALHGNEFFERHASIVEQVISYQASGLGTIARHSALK